MSEPRAITRPFVSAPIILTAMLSMPDRVTAAETADWRADLSRPDPLFTQMPLWFWNDDLDDEEIKRQLADFRAHGVYGFAIHPRMGLPKSISFMGDRWMGHVKCALEEADRTGMRVSLYDEWMYPSGSAHGEVVRESPDFAAQGLMMTHVDADGPGRVDLPPINEGTPVATVIARVLKGGQLDADAMQTVDPAEDTIHLESGPWRIMRFVQVPSNGHIRGVHEGEEDGQPGAPPAADLLNPDAMRAYIRLTYDPYDRVTRPYYGTTVIAMFTDEPSMLGRGARRGLKPWTGDFTACFQERRGYDIRPKLPALFVDIGPETRRIRNDVELTLMERLEETYYAPLSRWCEQRGIALTGHPAGSDEIRPLKYFHIPGQDMVWRWVLPAETSAMQGPDSTVAKCTSSVARHDGRRRNSNEIYGAYGWGLTMDEMKWLADWLMVRGVNLLYPHAFYYSMRDDRAMERPPDVGPNNAWWPHYRLFAEYTSRVCKLMTGGEQVCDVAVLAGELHLPTRAAQYLFEHQIDFNYLEPWRLHEQATIDRGVLEVGPCRYTTLIVDRDEPLPDDLAEKLRHFEQGGGRLRFFREPSREDLIAGIQRDVVADPPAPDLRCAHVRKNGIDFYYLTNEGETTVDTNLTVRCCGRAEWFDAWTCEFQEVRAVAAGDEGMTVSLHLDRRQSVILCIDSSSPPRFAATLPPRQEMTELPLDASWSLELRDRRLIDIPPGDWSTIEALRDAVGTFTYRADLDLVSSAGRRHLLDLGEVGDFAVLRLNGKDMGVRLWPPYRWDVTDALVNGRNELAVEVTNSLANRYTPDKRRRSGLLDPARIIEVAETRD